MKGVKIYDQKCRCEGKYRHRDKKDALKELESLMGRLNKHKYTQKGRNVYVYRCKKCRGWHVGSEEKETTPYERPCPGKVDFYSELELG